MLSAMFATVTDTTVPFGARPGAPGTSSEGLVETFVDVIGTVFDNLGKNGYQTGVALVAATIAVVAMLDVRVHRAVLIPVGIGAFWAGWLGWNTFTAQDNPLFPGDVSATKLWDVAFTSDTGFLLVVIVACSAAVLLWRKGTAFTSRMMLLAGAVLGASFLYNLVEAIRYA